MTQPQPSTIEREKDKLYVTDAELIRRLGVPERLGRRNIAALDANPRISGFPQPSPFWGNRRYWPAVQAWLERTNGTGVQRIS